jgi:hypothetical protein
MTTTMQRPLHPVLRRIAVAGLLLGALPFHASAAGGHFDVDDAAIVDAGRCQVETWITRASRASAMPAHVGPACRVGPVELGLTLDRDPLAGGPRDAAGAQVKWAVPALPDGLGAALVWGAAVDASRGGRPAQTLYAALTADLAPALQVHVNLGADRSEARERTRRLGVSGEWAACERLSLIAERALISREGISRLGARIALAESTSIDLSAARTSARGSRLYTIGLNHEFAR